MKQTPEKTVVKYYNIVFLTVSEGMRGNFWPDEQKKVSLRKN